MSAEKISSAAEPAKKHYDKLDLVFTVLPRGLGEKIIAINNEQGVFTNFICPGRGTATSSILGMFGLGATEKDVVLSCVRSDAVPEVLKNISERMEFDKPGSGIAFSIPLQSVAGANVLHYLTTASFWEE